MDQETKGRGGRGRSAEPRATAPHVDGGSPAGLAPSGRKVVSLSAVVPHEPAVAFRPILELGGERGWYYANWLWVARAWLDRLAGGPGLRPRRDPHDLRQGDAVGFWRVETLVPDRLLRLEAEMWLPGRGWLQYEVEPVEGEGSVIRQVATFDPAGVCGLAYWFASYPLHKLVFSGMMRAIVRVMDSDASST